MVVARTGGVVRINYQEALSKPCRRELSEAIAGKSGPTKCAQQSHEAICGSALALDAINGRRSRSDSLNHTSSSKILWPASASP